MCISSWLGCFSNKSLASISKFSIYFFVIKRYSFFYSISKLKILLSSKNKIYFQEIFHSISQFQKRFYQETF